MKKDKKMIGPDFVQNYSQKVSERQETQTPKDPPQFSGSFGNLNFKNRWMTIFIERKQFCH